MPAPTPEALAQQAIDKAKSERRNTMINCLKKKGTNALHTSDGLNDARSNLVSQSPPDKIWIQIEVQVNDGSKHRGASVDPTYGRSGRPWGPDDFLPDVLEDVLKTINMVWEKHHSISLVIDKVELQFSGNKVFHHGTQHATVGSTYKLYLTGDMAHLYKPGPQSKGSALLPQMHLEVIIDKVAGATDESTVAKTHTQTQKRYLSISSDESDDSAVQRPAPKKPHLASRFIRSTLPNRKSSQDNYMKIMFVCAESAFIADTSDLEFAWPDNDSAAESGLISKTALGKGAMKTAHKFMINSVPESYVVKQIFDVDDGPIDIKTNACSLQQELVRLKLGQWFLTRFLESANEKGLDVCKDIKFSKGFLIKEHSDIFKVIEDPAVWLVEPHHTTSVIKFSGTLCHLQRENKIGKTITAFAHFVYEVSQKAMVFADIQDHRVLMSFI
ncbi:hypothetical protein DXG01_004494 [Tephrocybe rancida]|nr:hypothetical protein DXG01_004494 [Tephrocybe rancida]